MNIFVKFNLWEAILWFVIGGVFLFFGYRKEKFSARQRKTSIFLSLMSALFGLSDLIEIHTGAWWRPTWLLILKAVCFTGIFLGLIYFLRRR